MNVDKNGSVNISRKREDFRIYGPLFLAAFLLLFFYGMLIRDVRTAINCVSVSIFYAVIAWESSRGVALFTRKQAPGIANTKKRLQLMVLYGLPVMLLVGFISHLFSFCIGCYNILAFSDYFFIVGLHLLLAVIAIFLYEHLYYIKNWKILYDESEDIKKININSQYNFLKDQVKPHFLFNSLNTLTSLIRTDVDRAELFTLEMATVYRYLLKRNDNNLATLKEELSFLTAYISMLKTRFEDALVIEMEIDQIYMSHLLPPLVLQLLVENAVKHNIISKCQPLRISIHTDDANNVHIYNNLQLKGSNETSEKKGLSNMIERYKLLKMENGLFILEEKNTFKVIVPLLAVNEFAHIVD